MSKQSAMERFEHWYSNTGHWVYESRAEALQAWKECGIDGLPAFPK